MKNIIIINSSYRKNNTYKLLIRIKDKLEILEFKCEIVNLKDCNYENCRGCEECILEEKCFISDDFTTLMDKIKNADGIIIGTPVYLNNMSGLLKCFLDRTPKWFHRSEVVGKPVLIVATTAGSGLKNTFRSVKESMLQWGVDVTGTIGRTIGNLNNEVEYKELNFFINHIITNRKSYNTKFRQVFTFNVQKALAVNIFPLDKEYWKEKGWINKEYFIDDNLKVFKRICGNLLFRLLKGVIKPHNRSTK